MKAAKARAHETEKKGKGGGGGGGGQAAHLAFKPQIEARQLAGWRPECSSR
eukprot:COSAG02_NODE_8410_length_2582_cov_3.531212_5_plen_50_part_01